MLAYTGSCLMETGKCTGAEKRTTLRILKDGVCDPGQDLIVEIEFWIPSDVTDITKVDKLRAEVVVKLKAKLMVGPLKDLKTDEELLDGARKFLRSNEGKTWMRDWFLPNTPEKTRNVAGPSSVLMENTGEALNRLKLHHLDVPGGTSDTTNPQSVRKGKGKAPAIPSSTSVEIPGTVVSRVPSTTMDLGASSSSTAANLPQGDRVPVVSFPTSVYSGASSASLAKSFQMTIAVINTPTPQGSDSVAGARVFGGAPSGAKYRASAVGNGSVMSQASPQGASASMGARSSSPTITVGLAPSRSTSSPHGRLHNDPGHDSYCLTCKSVHCVSYGGPFPTIAVSSPIMPSTGGAILQNIDMGRNERLMVRIRREAMGPLNTVAWWLLFVALSQLMEGFPSF